VYMFRTKTNVYGEELSARHQPPRRRTTLCRLLVTVYSIYSQLTSILKAVPHSSNWGRAMPWWQGTTCHGVAMTVWGNSGIGIWYILICFYYRLK
jgi:hypothetical protein